MTDVAPRYARRVCIADLFLRLIVQRSMGSYVRAVVFSGRGETRMMPNLSNPQKRPATREWLRRLDRIAGDLNVLLVVIAIGLATLDFTFLVTKKVVDSLPAATRITYDSPQPSDK